MKKMTKIKRILSVSLILMTLLSTFAIFNTFSIAAENGYDRGYKQTMAGTGKVVAQGLDISEHQKGIDLQKIKDAGFDYVIIRAGVKLNAGTNRKDYCFEDFYAQARKVGLDVGTYYYSQATNVSQAKEEAKCFIEYIKGKKFEYPVYLDFESSTVKNSIGSSATIATQICYAFMDTMRDAGCLVGLYGYASWFDSGYSGWMANKLENDIGKKYEFWMANYFNNMLPENTKTANYKNKYGMYQYTSSKTISGWSGSLDHNVCYKDYPAIVKQYKFNGYGDPIGSATSTSTSTSASTQKQTSKPSNSSTSSNNSNNKQTEITDESMFVTDIYTDPMVNESATVDEVNEGKGCKGAIGVGATLIAITGIVGASITIKRKRED